VPDGGRSNLNPAALHRSTIRAMSEGVAIHGPDGSIIDANPAAETILGLTLAQLTGRSPVDPRWRLIRHDGTPLHPSEIPSEITRHTGRPHQGHLGVHRPDGSVAWLLVRTDPVDDDDAPGHVVATFADETASVVAQRALEQERAHLRHIVELVPGGVFQVALRSNGERELTFMSDRLRLMLDVKDGSSPDIDSLRARVHPEDLGDLHESFFAMMDQHRPLSAEFRFRRVDEWLWFRLDGLPDVVAGERRWTCLIIDVSADRSMGERMRRAARREAMGEMAAGLAHNLNNLLATILPNLELSLQGGSDNRPMLEDALRATQSAAELMRHMLAFARHESEGLPRQPVDVTALAQDTMRFCKRTFSSMIQIETELPTLPLYVMGQASNLQQVLLNLCLNARDALAERQRPRLTVQLQAADHTDYVQLSVTDNGVGMAPNVARRLGEPFFTTKPPGQGTGLGLATVYGIVRELGGMIEVRSTPGVGTSFTVKLPRVARGGPQPTTQARRHLTGHALLIDDERLVRAVLRRQLERAGMTTTEAADGEAGLDLIAQGLARPDIILLDLTMPGLSGEVVLRRLIELGVTAPILVVSGHRGSSLELDGAWGVLRKPVDGETLLATVARALGQ
jgi:PAS domain S-box-containing protein